MKTTKERIVYLKMCYTCAETEWTEFQDIDCKKCGSNLIRLYSENQLDELINNIIHEINMCEAEYVDCFKSYIKYTIAEIFKKIIEEK